MAFPVALVMGGHFSLSTVSGGRGGGLTVASAACMLSLCGDSALGIMGGVTSAFQRMLGPLSSVFSMPWSSDCCVGSGMARLTGWSWEVTPRRT